MLLDPKTIFMKLALKEAHKGFQLGEVPIGAIILDPYQRVIAKAHNLTKLLGDPTAHAELLAIREASLNKSTLLGCSIYTSLEPCMMCFGAIIHSNLRELCYASPSKIDGVFSNHLIDELRYKKLKVFKNILAAESQKMLKDFFVIWRNA